MSNSTSQQLSDDISALEGSAIMFDVLKGGYGKSALSLNLADRLAARRNDVLYLDLDPNGHISFALNYNDVYHDGMHDYGFVTLDTKMYSKESLSPESMIYETDYGFDFVPSFDDMESFEAALSKQPQNEKVLARDFLLPLYTAGEYDYFILDGGGERSIVADNGFYAGRTAMIPLTPGDEALSALDRTWERIIKPLQTAGFNVLSLVPNLLSKRTDHRNADRVLLERLNQSDRFQDLVPSFARLTDDDWDRIDEGTYSGGLPGIRERKAISGGISTGQPAAHYDASCDQIKHFDELARIVERGGISR